MSPDRTNTVRILTVLLIMLASVGCDRDISLTLPREVEGVWTSDDPRYHDRLLELSPAFVIIVPGLHDRPSVQFINRVETQTIGAEMTFTVNTTDYSQDTHEVMTFRFRSANGGEIRFNNQSQVWKRGAPESN